MLSLGVSNLLWEPALDAEVAVSLQHLGISAIDIAPSRYFAPADSDDLQEATRVRDFWAERGITIVGLQSLLHGGVPAGQPEPHLFGRTEEKQQLLARLRQRIELAAALGARVLVFGSWPNRLRRSGPTPVEAEAALETAGDSFRRLAAFASDHGVILSIEPIFAGYGNDFLIDHDEAAALVRRVAHPGFGLCFDVGCAGLAGEDPAAVLDRHGDLVCHVQIAGRDLAPLVDSDWHRCAGPLLAGWLKARAATGQVLPGVCIEALCPPGADACATVRHSIEVVRRWYS